GEGRDLIRTERRDGGVGAGPGDRAGLGRGRRSVSAIRVMIVDDHPVVRDGLRGMLAGDPGLEVIAEASDGLEAVTLAEALRPDVILMDLRMPGMSGLSAIRSL